MATATLVAAGLTFIGTESAHAASDAPPVLPDGLTPYREVFQNWDQTIVTTGLWTCAPTDVSQLPLLADWAVANGWRLRPRGARHSWSPLTVTAGATAERVLLVDTTRSLTAMRMEGTDLIAQGGAMMDAIMPFLAGRGRGFTNIPAPGDVTLGGVLAVGAHGTSVPAAGETPAEGAVFGSVSNAVRAITVVAWNASAGRHELRTVERSDPDAGPLLVGLGRVFVAEARLRTQVAQNWRCRNLTHIHRSDLFAPPEKAGSRSLSALIDQAGRVGVIWYTFSDYPWIQRWDVAPQRPLGSRRVSAPYNYPFADRLPDSVAGLLEQLVAGHEEVAPAFGRAVSAATQVGLTASVARDMWGPAHCFQHFVRPTTLKVMAGSYALVVRRADVQDVVHRYTAFVSELLTTYGRRGRYPLNSCMELRVTGVDDPRAAGVSGAHAASLSAGAPDPDHPERDTVVWLDLLTVARTARTADFYRDVEAWLRTEFTAMGTLRPEWAKRFAHTTDAAWADADELRGRIPSVFPGFAHAQQVFARIDPHRIFASELTDAVQL